MLPMLLMAAVLFLVLIEAFFSGSETVLTSASKTFLQARAMEGDRRAGTARRLLERTERFLGTTLLGTNLAVVSSTTLCQYLVIHYLLPSAAFQRLESAIALPWPWPTVANTLIMTPLILLFGELIPKSVGRAHADRLALRVARPLYWAGTVLFPLSWLFGRAAAGLAQLLGLKKIHTALKPQVTRDDLRTIAEMAAEQGLVPEAAGSMLQTVFDLDRKPVSGLMVPLVDVASVSIDATIEEVERLSVETGFARFPVYENRVDDIVGIVSLRQLLYEAKEAPDAPSGRDAPIRPYVRRNISFIPESKPVGELLHELRYQRIPMAVVVDEHGGVTGILTLEDLLEEIVGDIQDERDRPALALRKIGDSQFECDGKLGIEELEEHLGLNIPREGFETAAGLVLKLAGRIPAAGETFSFADYSVEVLEVEKRRIRRLRFSRTATKGRQS